MASKSVLIISFLIVAQAGCTPTPEVPVKAGNMLENARQSHCPDRRTCIFDIEIKRGTDGIKLTGETNLHQAYTSLIDSLQAGGFSIIDSVRILPDTALVGDTLGLVTLSVANVRSLPRHSAELSTQALMGMPLKVYKKQDDWYYVQTPDQYLGWIDKDGFERINEAEISDWMRSERGMFVEMTGMILSAPDPESEPVSDLVGGDIFQLKGDSGLYVKVVLPDRREGWVLREQVHLIHDPAFSKVPDALTILETARTFIGRPYLWGGTSGKGFDCSGFTKTVYYLHGLIIPRDASQQVRVGEEVEVDSSLNDFEPGDLLFFGRKGNDGDLERVWHVAFYLGDGYMLHAAGRVRIESLRQGDPLFNEERLKTLVAARRINDRSMKSDPFLQTIGDAPYYRY